MVLTVSGSFGADLLQIIPEKNRDLQFIDLTKLPPALEGKGFREFICKHFLESQFDIMKNYPMISKSMERYAICFIDDKQNVNNTGAILIIDGVFSASRLFETLKSLTNGERRPLDGFPGLKLKSSSKEADRSYLLVVLDNHTVIIGEERNLRIVIATKTGKEKNIRANPSFQKYLLGIDKQSCMWRVGIFSKQFQEERIASQTGLTQGPGKAPGEENIVTGIQSYYWYLSGKENVDFNCILYVDKDFEKKFSDLDRNWLSALNILHCSWYLSAPQVSENGIKHHIFLRITESDLTKIPFLSLLSG